MHVDLLVKSGRVVMPGQGIYEMDVAIRKGKISALLSPGRAIEADRTYWTPGTNSYFRGVWMRTRI